MNRSDVVRPRWETPDPAGVRGSYGPRARRWAKRELGVTLGGWQAYALDRILRYGKRGDLVHRIACLGTARQNGKSVLVRTLCGWMLDEGQYLAPFGGWSTMLAAAHDAKQARIVYRGVGSDISRSKRLASLTRNTQYFGIERDHLLFDTVTSQPGSARGLSAGLIAWDEVMTQTDWAMWEALAPTQSAQRSPLMLLTSTAGRPDSIVLRGFYDRLRRQATGDEAPDPSFYGAWWESRDPDAGLDWAEIARANPGLDDGRLTRQAIMGEYQLLPSDSWKRERLNHFVDTVANGAFNPGVWAACRVPGTLGGVDGPFSLGVDIHPGWEYAAIVVGARRPDGRIGVEVHRDIRATGTAPITAERIIAEVEEFALDYPVRVIAYDSISGAAASFERNAVERGLPWKAYKTTDMMKAAMDLTEMALSKKLAVDDPMLDAQVPLVARRAYGQDGAFLFGRTASAGPIYGVIAMTLAAHEAAYEEQLPRIF